MKKFLTSILMIAMLLLLTSSRCNDGGCQCLQQNDSCDCRLTTADTTLTMTLLSKYVLFVPTAKVGWLYVELRNNTPNFYGEPEAYDIQVERLTDGEWQQLPIQPGKELVLRELVARAHVLRPYEARKDSFALEYWHFRFEPGHYRATLKFQRNRVVTYSWDMFAFCQRKEGEHVARTVEFDLVDSLPKHAEQEPPPCNCEARQRLLEQWREPKDTALAISISTGNWTAATIARSKVNISVANRTPDIFLFRPGNDYHVERFEQGQWRALPVAMPKLPSGLTAQKRERRQQAIKMGDPFGWLIQPGESDTYELQFPQIDHKFTAGRYRIAVTFRKLKPKPAEENANGLWCEETGDTDTRYAEFNLAK